MGRRETEKQKGTQTGTQTETEGVRQIDIYYQWSKPTDRPTMIINGKVSTHHQARSYTSIYNKDQNKRNIINHIKQTDPHTCK